MPQILFDDGAPPASEDTTRWSTSANFRSRRRRPEVDGYKVVYGNSVLDVTPNPLLEAKRLVVLNSVAREKLSKKKEALFLQKCFSDIGAHFHEDVALKYHAYSEIHKRDYSSSHVSLTSSRRDINDSSECLVTNVRKARKPRPLPRPIYHHKLKNATEKLFQSLQEGKNIAKYQLGVNAKTPDKKTITGWYSTSNVKEDSDMQRKKKAGNKDKVFPSVPTPEDSENDNESDILHIKRQMFVPKVQECVLGEDPDWLLDTVSAMRKDTVKRTLIPKTEDEEMKDKVSKILNATKKEKRCWTPPRCTCSDPNLLTFIPSKAENFDNILAHLKTSKSDPGIVSDSPYERKQKDLSLWLLSKFQSSRVPQMKEKKYEIPKIFHKDNATQQVPLYWDLLESKFKLSHSDKVEAADEWRNFRNIPHMPLSELKLDMVLDDLKSAGKWRRTRAIATCIRMAYLIHGNITGSLARKIRNSTGGAFPKMFMAPLEKLTEDREHLIRLGASILLYSLGLPCDKAKEVLNHVVNSQEYECDAWAAAFLLVSEGSFTRGVLCIILDFWMNASTATDMRKAIVVITHISISYPIIIVTLAQHLSSKDWELRLRVCKTLAIVQAPVPKSVISGLVKVMQSDLCNEVRWAAASALSCTGNIHLVHNICERFLVQPEAAGPLEGLHLMGTLGKATPGILKGYLRCLAHNNVVIKMEAIQVAERLQLKDERVLLALATLASDDISINVRVSALIVIGSLGIPTDMMEMQLLSVLRYDRSSRVRMAAAKVIRAQKSVSSEALKTVRLCCRTEEDKDISNTLVNFLSEAEVKYPDSVLLAQPPNLDSTVSIASNSMTFNPKRTLSSDTSDELFKSYLLNRMKKQSKSYNRNVTAISVPQEKM